MNANKIISWTVTALLVLLNALQTAQAQLKGDDIPGDVGLQAGTQAPPSLSFALPFYFYASSKYKKSGDGSISTDFNMVFTGIGASVVTNLKILNANYGASVILPFASNRLEGNLVNTKSNFQYTDSYIQPIQLGWHTKHADFTAGYGLFIPTGSYEQGGDNNSGLGMWANEFSGGTTVYFNKMKTLHFSTLLSYEIHSDKKDTDIKTGDILTIEGGLGKTWYHKTTGSPIPTIINAGIVYYMQYKVSSDKIPVGNTVFTGDKDRVYGLGAEGNIFIPKVRMQVNARWLSEMGAKNRFQGNTFFIMVGYMLKSFSKKKD
ncbi:MAG: transporter [Chitinophagaceae bacterium]